MRVLLTGGCGFIGSNLARRLAARPGFSVRVLDNESLGSRVDLGDFRGEFIRGDVRDPSAVRMAMTGVDAVVHLAADTRVIDSIADPRFNFDVNVAGGLNVLEAMRASGVRRLVNASTGGAILGDACPPVHEEMTARPLSPYGAAKLAMGGVLLRLCRKLRAADAVAALLERLRPRLPAQGQRGGGVPQASTRGRPADRLRRRLAGA